MVQGDRTRFHPVKESIHRGGIQAFPDFGVGDPFIFITDWSKENIAGCYLKCRTGRRGSSDVGERSVISMIGTTPVTRGSC